MSKLHGKERGTSSKLILCPFSKKVNQVVKTWFWSLQLKKKQRKKMENNKGIDNHYKNNCWTVAQTLESGWKKESYYHSSNHKKAGEFDNIREFQ